MWCQSRCQSAVDNLEYGMRYLLGLFVVGILVGCSGDGAETVTPPVQVPPSVDPAPVLLRNANVNCGEWSQRLADDFRPAYSLQRQQRWVVMGSSSAFGAGASKYDTSWAGLLVDVAKDYGAEVVNIARGGYTTYQAMSSDCDVASNRPQPDAAHNVDLAIELGADLVILSFPSNDAASNYTAEETAHNILYLRSRLADEGIALLVLGAQPRNMTKSKQKLLIELDDLLKPRFSPCLVELYRYLVDNTGNLASQYDAGDGVHLNDAGHAIVFEQLSKLFAERTDASCFN